MKKGMQTGVRPTTLNVEELRARLTKMSDKQLREFGEAARRMNSPKQKPGEAPFAEYVFQLEEATAEWRRRHPIVSSPRKISRRTDT